LQEKPIKKEKHMWRKNEVLWASLNELALTDKGTHDAVDYAQLWANDMENAQREGKHFSVIADRVAEQAPEVPGRILIFGYAAFILMQVWGQGDALRTWYQNRFQQSSDS
jgi:hypothetical protein